MQEALLEGSTECSARKEDLEEEDLPVESTWVQNAVADGSAKALEVFSKSEQTTGKNPRASEYRRRYITHH